MSEPTVPTRIHGGMTVNEIIREYPATVELFNRFGIDACCGGAMPIRAAAQRDGADLEELWSALRSVTENRT